MKRALWLAALAAGGCLDTTMRPVTVGAPIARLEIVAPDTAFLLGHSLTLGVTAWDSAGQPIPAPRVFWSSSYPTWCPVDANGLVSGSVTPGNFPIYVEALGTGVRDTQVVHIAYPGEVKWRRALGAMPTLGGPAEGIDGTLYVLGDIDATGYQATLFAVSPGGDVRWQHRLDQVDGTNYPVVGTDGTVYVVGQYVHSFLANGTALWSMTTRPAENPPSTPSGNSGAISNDGSLYAAMAYDLFVLHGSSGDTVWVGPHAADAGWLLPPTVSADGKTAYIKNTADSLYAFRSTDGGIRWGLPDSSGRIFFGQGAAVAGGRLVIPNGTLLQEADTGGALIAATPNVGFGISEPAIGPEGLLYVQVPQNVGVYAFNPADVEQWRFLRARSKYPLYGGPALAVGRVLYAAGFDAFYAIQLSDTGASILWRYPSDPLQHIFVGAPLIGSDGTVYSFSSCDYGRETGPCSDELFAFWADLPVEPNSPWPMWRHDARRSGQAHK